MTLGLVIPNIFASSPPRRMPPTGFMGNPLFGGGGLFGGMTPFGPPGPTGGGSASDSGCTSDRCHGCYDQCDWRGYSTSEGDGECYDVCIRRMGGLDVRAKTYVPRDCCGGEKPNPCDMYDPDCLGAGRRDGETCIVGWNVKSDRCQCKCTDDDDWWDLAGGRPGDDGEGWGLALGAVVMPMGGTALEGAGGGIFVGTTLTGAQLAVLVAALAALAYTTAQMTESLLGRLKKWHPKRADKFDKEDADPEACWYLYQTYKVLCADFRCDPADSCDETELKIARGLACMAAFDLHQATCYKSPEVGHETQYAGWWNRVLGCSEILAGQVTAGLC